MKMIKCYEDYVKLRKELKSKQYDLMNDSIDLKLRFTCKYYRKLEATL